MLTLRHISALAINQDSGWESGPAPEFMERTTKEELVKAVREFDAWWDSVIDKQYGVKEQNKAYSAIWALVMAYQQHAHESGLCMGIRLMHAAMADVSTLEEIECLSQKKMHITIDD